MGFGPGTLDSTSSTYDSNDRLTSDSYDANGNTTNGYVVSGSSAVADRYDFEDHLINRNAGQVTVVYDGDGNRVAKTVGGVTTLFLVDDRNPSGYAQVLEEHTLVSSTITTLNRAYTYGTDLISQDQWTGSAWQLNFYGYDGHGNVRYLTDTNAAIIDTYDYDAFGTLIAQTGTTPNNYLYCGEQFDPDLGLYYNRARYLNADSGRFWRRDVFEGYLDDVLTLSAYLYAGQDPIGNLDPSGFYDLNDASAAEAVDEDVEAAATKEETRQTQKTFRRQACHLSSLMIGSYNELESLTEFGFQKHHIYQKASFKGVGNYNPGKAMAVYLLGGSSALGSPHDLASRFQNNTAAGVGATQIATDALIAAGCSPDDAKKIVTVAKEQMENEFKIPGL